MGLTQREMLIDRACRAIATPREWQEWTNRLPPHWPITARDVWVVILRKEFGRIAAERNDNEDRTHFIRRA